MDRPDIQGFVGTLHDQQADGGIFIMTSEFSADAYDYVKRVGFRIVLTDREVFVLKRLDEDFFEEA